MMSAMTNLSLYLTESADMYPGAAAVRCEGTTNDVFRAC